VKKNKIILDLTFKTYNQAETISVLTDQIWGMDNTITQLHGDVEVALIEMEGLRRMLQKYETEGWKLEEKPVTPTAPKVKVERTRAQKNMRISWKKVVDKLLEEPAGTKLHVPYAPPTASKSVHRYQLQHEYKGGELYVWYPTDRPPVSDESGV